MNFRKVKFNAKGVSLKLVGWIISAIAVVISGLLVFSLYSINTEYNEVYKSTQLYLDMKDSAADIQLASDYLTDQVRTFVVTNDHDAKYMDNYFVETNITKRREKALDIIHENIEQSSVHDEVHYFLKTAVDESLNLQKLEHYAMKLICEAHDIDYSKYPAIAEADISAVSPADRDQEAIIAVFGADYLDSKNKIQSNIDIAVSKLDDAAEKDFINSTSSLRVLIIFQTALISANIIFVAASIIFLHIYVLNPMNHAVTALLNDEKVSIRSNKEFNYLADTYNRIHTQNEHIKEKLIYEAEHDKLTGLFNRTGYDSIYRRIKLENAIYILLDIDKFKEVNDNFGHEMGDRVLVRTAKTLEKYFNEQDSYIFRIGGDEFAIIIENVTSDIDALVLEKCKKMDQELSKSHAKIPGTTLSIGVARGDINDTTDTLFKKADIALYKVKQAGKADVTLYQEQ